MYYLENKLLRVCYTSLKHIKDDIFQRTVVQCILDVIVKAKLQKVAFEKQ